MASSNASRSSPISSHAEPAHARIERALQLPAERKEWCRSTQLRFCRAPPCGGQCGSPILAETTCLGPELNTADGRAILGPELKPHGLAERVAAVQPPLSLTHVNIHHRRTGMYYCRTSSDHEAWPLHSPGPSACGSAHAWKQKSRPERHTHVVDSSATSSPRRVHSVTTEPLRGPRIVLPWGSHPGATG